jgi:hypothetical protein
MIRPQVRITFTQVTTATYPNRRGQFVMPYVTEATISDSWTSLTNTAKLVFAKNILFRTTEGVAYDLNGKNLIAPDGNQPPFFMRGDKVKIEAGYYYYDAAGNEQIRQLTEIFDGFVTKVTVKIPVEIDCEDNMFKLKQIAAPNKVYKAAQYNVEDIVKELIQGTGFTFVDAPQGIKTNVGDFRTQNETVAQVLLRLKKDYRIHSFFKGDKLYCSGIVYYPDLAPTPYPAFVFEKNIISDDLVYTRTDDIRLGAKAYSVNKAELTSFNINGKKKTTHKRLEVSVGAIDGEMRTLYFWNVKSAADLKIMAEDRLRRFYYQGYKGKYTTFGEPVVTSCNQVIVASTVLPERNGLYYVKAVTHTIGINGYRQEIELDIKVADIDNKFNITTRNLTEKEVEGGI